MTPSWSYATVAEAQAYLGGSAASLVFDTAGSGLLLMLLESASRRCEQFVNRVWAPHTQTIALDLGRSGARDDRLSDDFRGRFPGLYDDRGGISSAFTYDEWPDYWPGGFLPGRRVNLGDWLLTPTTVTSYSDTARDNQTTLVEGITADYLLSPPDGPPYRDLMLTETSNASLGRGQQVLTIAGEWGWPYTLMTVGALTADIDASTTTLTGASFTPGQLLRIGSESIYLGASPSAAYSVQRGVAGTTAAAHVSGTPIAQVVYPSDLVETTLEITRIRYMARSQTAAQVTQVMAITQTSYPGSEEAPVLKRLQFYKGRAVKAHAF